MILDNFYKSNLYTSNFDNIDLLIGRNLEPIAICDETEIPEWYKGLKYTKLAPTPYLTEMWREKQDNEYYYIKEFYERVLNSLDAYKVYREINQMILYMSPFNKTACLIGYDTSEKYFSHRQIVADWFGRNFIGCHEYKLNA